MPRPSLSRTSFGHAPDGTEVDCWRLDSGTGVQAEVLTFGGLLHTLRVPDTTGERACIVHTLPTVQQYAEHSPYFGAVVGRFANRIAGGRFTLDGTQYSVPQNDRGHALHGGPDGFDRRVWQAVPRLQPNRSELRLTLHSPDGDMGFPGALDVTATYTLDQAGTLALTCTATAERATHINLTGHSYFNLAGRGDIREHTLEVAADAYLPVTAEGIPLGTPAQVAGTCFDLTVARRIGDGLDKPDRQLTDAGGYDHCWVLRPVPAPPGPRSPQGSADGPADRLRRAAVLATPDGNRRLEVWTTEPGLQVYTGNRLDGSLAGPDGRPYERHSAVCLEAQHFPDSPNRPGYPSTVLRPGERFSSRTEYRFPHLQPAGSAEPAPEHAETGRQKI